MPGQDKSLKAIDFMNVMRAPGEYDIARTYYLISNVNKEFGDLYLKEMGYSSKALSLYIKLVELYHKLEG